MQKFFLDHAWLTDGWANAVALDVEAGHIRAIHANANPEGRERISGIVLPGLANLHSHSFQRAMAGLTERRGPASDSFWTWRQVMYRFVGSLSADDVETIAAFAFMEMLEAGFTAVGEFHYLHHDQNGAAYANPAEHCERLAAAAQETGISLTLLPVLYTYSGFGAQPPHQGQRRFINSIDAFLALTEKARQALAALPNANLGVAPHSLRAVNPPDLARLLSATPEGPIHVHVAEQMQEVEDCLAWSGQRPVEWLLNHASVDPRWCLVHATQMTDSETRALAASGAVAGLCPITEANLGDGVFNAPIYCAAQGRYGVGSDSNVEITALGELKQLEYSQRLALRARNVMALQEGQSTGAALYGSALAGGAQALGRNSGALVAGARADFVVLDQNHPDLATCNPDHWLDASIFSAGKAAIDAVYVGGDRLVSTGRHRNRDAISRRYSRAMARIMAAQ